MLSIVAGAATSTGRVRALNEDSYYLGSSLFAIADGMGGHRAGDRASSLAISHVAGIRHARPRAEEVLAAIQDASEAIADEAAHDETCRGMGTTLVGLSLTELAGSPHWLVFNVGDSRLYSYVGGELHQVTVDHSEVQELLESGEIGAAEADSHPHRHIITRSMGTRPAPAVDTWMLPHDPGTLFLLCSDGLTTELDSEQIAHLLRISDTPQIAADRLIEAAEAAGGRDNITVVVVRAARPGDDSLTSLDDEQTLPRESGDNA